MKTLRKKLIKNLKDMRKRKTLLAYVVRLGAFLVNKSWNGSFMNMNASLALLRLAWVICMTGILKSLAVIHLGKKKLGERVQKDTSCQKWPFLSADSVEMRNTGSSRVNM